MSLVVRDCSDRRGLCLMPNAAVEGQYAITVIMIYYNE